MRAIHYEGLLRQNQGYYGKYKTAFFEKNNFNVLFLGSSRVEMHYNTQLFDQLTGSNSFNLGSQGATPQVAFAILKGYLLNSSAPKYLFYEIDFHFLKHKSTVVKEFNNYFPFLSNKALRTQFNTIDSRMNYFYFNPYFSFPYTGLKNLSTGMHGWLNIPNKTDSLYHKGYLKEVFRPNLNFIDTKPYTTFFNITNRNYLDSIILLCKNNQIKLHLISSPMFAGAKVDLLNKEQIITQIARIATINNIPFHNISSLPFCSNRNLFIDHFHMNHKGAHKFSLYFGQFFNNKIAN